MLECSSKTNPLRETLLLQAGSYVVFEVYTNGEPADSSGDFVSAGGRFNKEEASTFKEVGFLGCSCTFKSCKETQGLLPFPFFSCDARTSVVYHAETLRCVVD